MIVIMIFSVLLPGCSNERDGIIEPNKEISNNGISYGKLHNEIMKEYLIIAYKEKLFKYYGDEGWRIPWNKAKKAMLKACNKTFQENNLPIISEKDLETIMNRILELSNKGVLDLFHPETVSPESINKAANMGYIDKKISKGL